MAADFIDTPMFWGLDGSNMDFDRFEFSFDRTRAEWEAEQRRYQEFNRKFDAKQKAKPTAADIQFLDFKVSREVFSARVASYLGKTNWCVTIF